MQSPSQAKNRPSWESYFLQLAQVVKTRTNCFRLSVGVVIVRDKQIISTGYNGTPRGIQNCFDGGCKRCYDRHTNKMLKDERKDLCICVHAEENALIQSAYHGIATKGAVMYTTVAPCILCAKAIINAGISEVVYIEDHQDELGKELLKEGGVKVKKGKI